MKKLKKYDGFVALISVIILVVIIFLAVIMVLYIQSFRIFSDLATMHSIISRHNAESCIDKGLEELKSDDTYEGEELIELHVGSCYLGPIEGAGNTNRIVKSTGYYKDSLVRIEVVVGTISPDVEFASWKEVAEFTVL